MMHQKDVMVVINNLVEEQSCRGLFTAAPNASQDGRYEDDSLEHIQLRRSDGCMINYTWLLVP